MRSSQHSRPLPDSNMANVKSCGSLHCQRDSYARSLDSVVVSCKPSQAKEHQGKYELVLEDTVLFPEGGGQVQQKLCDCSRDVQRSCRDTNLYCFTGKKTVKS